ncbi:hypothetical protein [Nitrobacter hamburgensis]|uniref:hypothetical protein n=1 Tax=Nitrobacter hamburgensis TaxID=912 RepID=UPI0002FADFFA|nr:hypothetical protein [Nitrobacter hamburgensis]
MRNPTARELKVLNYFVGDHVEHSDRFAGAGEKTIKDMVDMGWIVQVDPSETSVRGYYRITPAGEAVR